jgi:hypothetical protein
MELYLRYLGMQTSPPACLRHAVNGTLGARMMREGTNLHMRVSQRLSTRLGGVHKKLTQRISSAFFVPLS